MSRRETAKARIALIAALFLLFAGMWAGAQETGSIDTNVDSLFGDEEVVEEAPAQPSSDAAKQNPVTAALKSDKVRVGGSFSGSITPSATWADFWDGDLALSDSNTSLGTSLKSTLFFDARPSEDLRVYGSVKAAYPFSTETADGVLVPNLSVFELFADFNLNDKVYFRMGKSTEMGRGLLLESRRRHQPGADQRIGCRGSARGSDQLPHKRPHCRNAE